MGIIGQAAGCINMHFRHKISGEMREGQASGFWYTNTQGHFVFLTCSHTIKDKETADYYLVHARVHQEHSRPDTSRNDQYRDVAFHKHIPQSDLCQFGLTLGTPQARPRFCMTSGDLTKRGPHITAGHTIVSVGYHAQLDDVPNFRRNTDNVLFHMPANPAVIRSANVNYDNFFYPHFRAVGVGKLLQYQRTTTGGWKWDFGAVHSISGWHGISGSMIFTFNDEIVPEVIGVCT